MELAQEFVVWQCIGCGRIEGPQPCIGVCQDRKVSFVYASDYAEVMSRLLDAEDRLALLESLARRMAHSTPRDGEWERGYRSLQQEARMLLKEAQGARPTGRPARRRPRRPPRNRDRQVDETQRPRARGGAVSPARSFT
jgi:hypothetical protein